MVKSTTRWGLVTAGGMLSAFIMGHYLADMAAVFVAAGMAGLFGLLGAAVIGGD